MRRLITAVLAAAVLMAGMPAGQVEAHTGIDRATNNFRVAHDKRRLDTGYRLWELAKVRVRQIAKSGGFHHPYDWGWMFDRLPGCVSGLGENLAWYTTGYEPSGWPVSAWKKSDTHRANMLGKWHWQASAKYKAPNGRTYAVQLFAKGCWWRDSL